jgi:hypothetical protein
VGGVRRCAGGLDQPAVKAAPDEVLVEQTGRARSQQACSSSALAGQASTPRRHDGLPRVARYLSRCPIAGVDRELDDDTGPARCYDGLAAADDASAA